MSKNNNVNPGQYKTRGRERPGEGILHEKNKETASINEHRLREKATEHEPDEKPDAGGGNT